MHWSRSERQRAALIMGASFTMKHIKLKTTRSTGYLACILFIIAIAGYQIGKTTSERKDMGSLYVTVDDAGVPTPYIPLNVAYPDESAVYQFVEHCMTLMLDVDSLSYREQILSFLYECMTIEDGVQFVYAFRDSGFLDLINAGAVLQLDVTAVDQAGQYVSPEGVLHKRFDVSGLVYVLRNQSITTPLELSVIVRRQNVDQYVQGVTISQVIW